MSVCVRLQSLMMAQALCYGSSHYGHIEMRPFMSAQLPTALEKLTLALNLLFQKVRIHSLPFFLSLKQHITVLALHEDVQLQLFYLNSLHVLCNQEWCICEIKITLAVDLVPLTLSFTQIITILRTWQTGIELKLDSAGGLTDRSWGRAGHAKSFSCQFPFNFEVPHVITVSLGKYSLCLMKLPLHSNTAGRSD